MDKSSFCTLLDIIRDQLPSTGKNKKRGSVPNGPIAKAAQLSMALRYFAGGDPLDIWHIHGVFDDKVLTSMWIVVDGIYASKVLDIMFPESMV